MSGRGSGGNVLAAVCSLVFPGSGQLFQGRAGAAVVHSLLAFVFWPVCIVLFFCLSPAAIIAAVSVNIGSSHDAATFDG